MSYGKLDYYWRDYHGTIPYDAVVAGKSGQDENVYIGQAYTRHHGLMVIQITPDQKEFYAAIKGVEKVDNHHIKILCGNQHNFIWVQATADDLHVKVSGKHAVIGGHEDGYGVLNIGRIGYEGGTQVGKINAFFTGNAYFKHVVNHCKESGEVQGYEVLVYEKCTCC